MRTVLREPLFQFLIGGLLLFLLLGPEAPEEEASDTIRITDEALITYLQFRQKQFDVEAARTQLASLPPAARNRLVAEFLEEEVLYREAVALGLDAGDDIIRKRLVQKMDFLLRGFEDGSTDISQRAIEAYFDAHRDRYHREARASFTHIFFSAQSGSDTAAADRANRFAAQLRGGAVLPEQAGRYGDRFPYLRTYADRPRRMITEHFGPDMTERLFTTATVGEWSGPYRSPYGMHFLYLRDRTPATDPPLDAVEKAVMADMRRDRRLAARQAGIESLKARYRIVDESTDEAVGESEGESWAESGGESGGESEPE